MLFGSSHCGANLHLPELENLEQGEGWEEERGLCGPQLVP